MTRRLHCLLAWLALALGGLGCVGSPQPSPPNLAPEGISRRSNGADIQDGIMVTADPGTVTPAQGVVVITNLDRVSSPTIEPVRADGGFEVPVDGVPQDEYRIQIRSGAARSVPLDVVGDPRTPILSPAPRPLADCLFVEPAYELDLGEVGAGDRQDDIVTITNECASEVTLAPPTLREADAPFELALSATVVAPGASVELTVTAVPTAPGSLEANLFVVATAPERDRRPLTLFLRGTD